MTDKPEKNRGNPLRLAEGPILVEQIRLLLGNVGATVAPTFVFAIILVWSLANGTNITALLVWSAAIIVAKLHAAYDARRLLAGVIAPAAARRLVWKLMAAKAMDGAIWGALAWITMDTASLAGSVLVLAFLAGIAGSAVSLYSPVFPVFVLFIAAQLLTITLKLWLMGDVAFQALGLVAALYLATLLVQARNSAKAALASINLRFENIELIEKLRIETSKAQAADRAKSKFLAAASHDLRQPIQAQSLFLGLVARGPLTAVQREALDGANAATQSTASVLDALLDFSRIEAGVIEPAVAPFRAQPLLQRLGEEMAPQAAAKGLACRVHATAATVRSDPQLVELILRNLVSNAIRYTERGGVLIGCRTRGDALVIEVWDTGIGIEASQHAEVFREFHQLGNPERDRNKGLGLGLAIAQGLATTLGHSLTLASKVQRGSVFRLSLPLASPVEAAGAVAAMDPAAMVPAETLSDQMRKPDAGHSFGFPVRVLVLDDEAMVRASLAGLLSDWGCVCDAAESIDAALGFARRALPDLIISDYRLRESLTGAQAIAALRAAAGVDVPALLITGDTAPERLREAHASGIPLLHKPVAPERLYDEMCRLLKPAVLGTKEAAAV